MKKDFIPLEKRSKKQQKEYHKKQRQINGFNTGTRDMKSEKYPTREEEKRKLRECLDNEDY